MARSLALEQPIQVELGLVARSLELEYAGVPHWPSADRAVRGWEF